MSYQPTIFGRYQLLEPIAKGGMAEVFKAKLAAAAGTEKVLCIKRILPSLSSNSQFIALFVREAKIALSLTHGNITQVFDFGEVEGVYYLAMEYLSGQDLNTVLRRVREIGGRLDVAAALYIAVEVCKGLHYAHTFTDPAGKTQAVVHRDVTPHNILISYSGEVKLTDFGIALAASKAATDREIVRGKACYLAPEQAAGNPASVRSDIFSLGAVLYEMLTGTRPFEADSERETLERLRTLDVLEPSQYNDQVDAELDAIIGRALVRDPAQRYGRASDLQVALTQVLHRRWPDYTGEKLAESMRDLFAWELTGGNGEGEADRLRDRLLFQLSRAGMKVDASKATTAELLELGTVAIGKLTQLDAATARRGWLRWVGLGSLAIVAVAAAVVIALHPWKRGGSAQRADAGERPPPLTIRSTDHLGPTSDDTDEKVPRPRETATKETTLTSGLGTSLRKMAFLNCNSWPWSIVYIDGKAQRGNTPLFRVRVPAGRRHLRFVNPELGLSKEVTVSVEAGDTKTVAVSLQQ